MHLRNTEYENFLSNGVYLFSYFDFLKWCIVLAETIVHN